MNRLTSILTVAVVLVAPALALAEGRSRRSHKIENEFLKKELAHLCEENWHLKHAVLAADRAMARKAGAFEHGVDLGAALVKMTAQEAKAAAKLNHPHIGIVHGIEEAEGMTFIKRLSRSENPTVGIYPDILRFFLASLL